MICETTRKGKGESEEEVKPGDLLYGMDVFLVGKRQVKIPGFFAPFFIIRKVFGSEIIKE